MCLMRPWCGESEWGSISSGFPMVGSLEEVPWFSICFNKKNDPQVQSFGKFIILFMFTLIYFPNHRSQHVFGTKFCSYCKEEQIRFHADFMPTLAAFLLNRSWFRWIAEMWINLVSLLILYCLLVRDGRILKEHGQHDLGNVTLLFFYIQIVCTCSS